MPRGFTLPLIGAKIKQKGGDKECLKKEKDSH
jgi:hypothetical protein